MDYHSVHGHDIASSDISGTHRLPTISASQALVGAGASHQPCISTGLTGLDEALRDPNARHLPRESETEDSITSGIKRGQVIEIWGPPGSGKTALGLQLTAIALGGGGNVTWIDCKHSVPYERVRCVVQKQLQRQNAHTAATRAEEDSRFQHYSCLTLPHLLALLSRPAMQASGRTTSLVVINSCSSLVNSALPRVQEAKSSAKASKGSTASGKRLQALQSIIVSLQKLAATRNAAVVVLSQCATKLVSEDGATLVPSINASVWEQGISTRVALFRNWSRTEDKGPQSTYVAGVQKLDGKAEDEALANGIAFTIDTDGITEVPYEPWDHASYYEQSKRKFGETELETPGIGEGDEYGWLEGDESALPPQPSQWQGSEDILLAPDLAPSDEGSHNGTINDSEDEDNDDDDDENDAKRSVHENSQDSSKSEVE